MEASNGDNVRGNAMRRKSPVLAAVLGLILTVFSPLYFGWRAFLVALGTWLVAVTCSVLLQWLFGLYLPRWSAWIWPPFFAVAGILISVMWNGMLTQPPPVLSAGEKWELAAAIAIPLGLWEFRISIGIATISAIVQAFATSRVFAGILALLILPLGVSIAARWLGMLLSLILTPLALIGSNRE